VIGESAHLEEVSVAITVGHRRIEMGLKTEPIVGDLPRKAVVEGELIETPVIFA
jgi:hypothetical protein